LILENDKEKQNKITEVKIHLPGIELFAKKHAKSFEESIDLSFEAIRKQIQKDKEMKFTLLLNVELMKFIIKKLKNHNIKF
jgi:putative sigma-54 modulation protein